MRVGDIIKRRGTRPWFDKTGTIVQIKYVHGDATYGVAWFGKDRNGNPRRIQFFKKADLKVFQAVGA
jgi:hypothetical protein